jgi:hypothetical protein
VIAYKFLLPDRRGPFTGREWREDEWLEAEGALVPCRNGVHAFRTSDLAYWLTDDLWEVALDGEIVESDLKLLARRGRLVRRIDAWDPEARRAFAYECLRRVARCAADELRDAGLGEAAASLDEAGDGDPGVLAAAAEAGAGVAEERGAVAAERLVRYAGDAAGWATSLPPAGVAFVAAHARRVRTRAGFGDPFAAERAEQSAWLARRLGLTSGAAERT